MFFWFRRNCKKSFTHTQFGGRLMKTIFRFLALAMLLTAFTAATVTPGFAQDQAAEKKRLYDTHLANYAANDVDKLQIALDAAKTYVEKFGESADDKEQVAYYKSETARLEKAIADLKAKVVKEREAKDMQALFTRFDTALKGTGGKANPSETYAAGKEIVAKQPDFIDVILVLGSVGFDQAVANPPVDTYNEDAITYAKMAIQKIEENKPSKTGNYGVLQYAYKNKENPDGKSNALNWMNYNIGYILYYRQGKDNPAKKKEALPYLYKATKYTSTNQKNPTAYQAIGAWYLDEAIRIDKERTAILTANGNKDNEQTLAMVGEQKGYADRAIDAYSRAYKLAKGAAKPNKEYTDGLYTRLKELYAFRYDGKTTGIDEFVAKVDTTPFPDPTTAITPVKIETTEPAATTSSTTTPATTAPATTPATTTPTPKPATTPATTTKPPTAGTTTGSTAETKPAAAVKTNAKKPAPKKKGTR
jgi:hypothetical protein